MSENKCPDCGLDFDIREWFIFEARDLLCHSCHAVYSLLAMARYVGEQEAGETTAHNFQLSYPYTCVCGYKHKVVAIFCHPIDITKQLESMKKAVPNDPNTENTG